MLSNKVYNALKYVALVALPAVATFYSIVAVIWGLPFMEEIPATIAAVETLLGTLLCISTAKYNKKKADETLIEDPSEVE